MVCLLCERFILKQDSLKYLLMLNNVKVAYPRVRCTRPWVDLVDHSVQCLEVCAVVTFDLVNIVGFWDGSVPFSFIGSDLCFPAYIIYENILQEPCREVIYAHGIHAFYFSVLGKLYAVTAFFFLALCNYGLSFLSQRQQERTHQRARCHPPDGCRLVPLPP